MDYTWEDSPVGRLLIAADDAGLRFVMFAEGQAEIRPKADWRDDRTRLAETIRQLRAYFAGALREFDLPLAPEGTEFQQRVWRELLTVPFGTTISYGELARRIGSPKASRAVGLANGANPIGIVIPCHRVIGSDGTLTGYGGGLKNKAWLLAHEQGRLPIGL